MSSKRVIVNEDGSVELPKSADGPKFLELVWDGRVVTTSGYKIPNSFINRCQDALKSHSSIVNVISTEAVEGIEGPGFPLSVPSLFDPRINKIPPIWGDDDFGRLGDEKGTVISISSEIELFLKSSNINWADSRDYESKLYNKMAGRAISDSLLEDFAAKLNKRVTNEIMECAYHEGETSYKEIIRKRSEGESWRSNPYENIIRSYGMGAKVMVHPQALELIVDSKNLGQWKLESTSENVSLCLNWDMPKQSNDTVEVVVGNFSQFMMILKPIKLTLEYFESNWKIRAETQALCGLWSAVSLGFAKARIKLQGK